MLRDRRILNKKTHTHNHTIMFINKYDASFCIQIMSIYLNTSSPKRNINIIQNLTSSDTFMYTYQEKVYSKIG